MTDTLADYQSMTPADLTAAIVRRKAEWGSSLVILGHHYQDMAVVGVADHVGDSLKLCRLAAAQREARHVLFCGVKFMAEAADILTPDTTTVQLAAFGAGCPMADMADIPEVTAAYDRISALKGAAPAPVVYMNSSSELKAFCGSRGGVVCTSSNAARIMQWGMDTAGSVLFFPDANLGLNSARALGLPPGQVVVWDRRREDGGLKDKALAEARVVLWNGFCHVHVSFTPKQVEAVRQAFPRAKVVVHPECSPEVTALCDAVGSTEMIIDFLRSQEAGARVYVGTEVHLVERMARDLPRLTVLPLSIGAVCYNMAKTTLAQVALALDPDNLGVRGRVTVDPAVARDARTALDRMLTL